MFYTIVVKIPTEQLAQVLQDCNEIMPATVLRCGNVVTELRFTTKYPIVWQKMNEIVGHITGEYDTMIYS